MLSSDTDLFDLFKGVEGLGHHVQHLDGAHAWDALQHIAADASSILQEDAALQSSTAMQQGSMLYVRTRAAAG